MHDFMAWQTSVLEPNSLDIGAWSKNLPRAKDGLPAPMILEVEEFMKKRSQPPGKPVPTAQTPAEDTPLAGYVLEKSEDDAGNETFYVVHKDAAIDIELEGGCKWTLYMADSEKAALWKGEPADPVYVVDLVTTHLQAVNSKTNMSPGKPRGMTPGERKDREREDNSGQTCVHGPTLSFVSFSNLFCAIGQGPPPIEDKAQKDPKAPLRIEHDHS